MTSFLPPVGKLHGTALSLVKVPGLDLAAIDQGQRQPLRQTGPELFHQVQSTSRPPRPRGMKPPDVWVQPGGRQRGQTIVAHQGHR